MSVGHLDDVLLLTTYGSNRWKRYVDDVLELTKKGQVRNLMDHINTTDPTSNNIKYTYEEEEDSRSHSWTLF